ncbi:prostatic acid phosphatase-like [Sitodiplosis mosellana]|uniref:prostatic acid phosphatase-like n=1 Tax=Sitodiplosis mosellana TaxID=263140 RepID=UPI002444A7D1|nr:prostatic acid phosphatase-like [Sitodiplosis mosellana]
MRSVLNNIIRILLASSVHCLKYTEPLCTKIPKTNAKCKLDNVRVEDQLVFAHVIFRHGERNIEKSYPNDPYKEEKYWLGGFGALTNVGKREVYELGKYLRRRYSELIGDSYSPKNIYIRSTDFDRTLMSASVLAAAVYPPSGDEIWNDEIAWQPVPIHTGPLHEEQLLPWKIPCPRFMFLFEQYQSSPEYKSIFARYEPSIKHWERHSGQSLDKLADIMYLYDTLFVENRKGFVLDDWANEALWDSTLKYLAAFHLQSFTHSTELKKLEAGYVIKDMLDRFRNKSQSLLKPNQSIWHGSLHVYACHDLSIVNILNALNLYDLHIPNYASSLHFELYRTNGTEYYVQLFYRNQNQEIVDSPLEIPNCGTKCHLDQFNELYRDILPTESEDYDSVCRVST